MTPRCLNCGMKRQPGTEFCGRCGARFGNDPKKNRKIPKKKLKTYTKVSAIKPCELDTIPFLERAVFYYMWMKGRCKLTFCNCPLCKKALQDLMLAPHTKEKKMKFRRMERTYENEIRSLDISKLDVQFPVQ